MKPTLLNLESFTVPYESYICKWIFEDEDDNPAPISHQDQIFLLNKEAARFLWDFDMVSDITCTKKHFRRISVFDSSTADHQTIKKYLFNLRIPFDTRVLISLQPDIGFVLTWKMVIKYAHHLFVASDLYVYDRTFNWLLEFDHNDYFKFGRNDI
ncbi:MAG: hypothetical protein EOO00_03065 [Chitinophagaceae bacterium]|nr:MAG: hypothetical protein EOO00_03065 [Chitinophagaceae bacterium]